MYRVILGVEDLYYERVEEWELMVFTNYNDASKFASEYTLDHIDRYIKVVDDNDMVQGYKKHMVQELKSNTRNIGFG